LEMGENLAIESMPSQIEVNQRLKEMEERKILGRVRVSSGKEKYILAEK